MYSFDFGLKLYSYCIIFQAVTESVPQLWLIPQSIAFAEKMKADLSLLFSKSN